MFNPFEPFTAPLIQGLTSKGFQWLVAQTNKRVAPLDAQGKESILLTHYNNLGLAQAHKNAIKHDRYASILDLKNEIHLAKLQEMMGALSKYMLWIAMVTDKDKKDRHLDRKYKQKMRSWINSNTTWRFSADTEFIVDYELIFGDLMVVMRYAGQMVRIPLTVIENL